MTRLKGPAGNFDFKALEALDLAGRGKRILIAAPSLEIPRHNEQILGFRGTYSADVVRFLAQIIPIKDDTFDCMATDPSTQRATAEGMFRGVAEQPIIDADGNTISLTLNPLLKDDFIKRVNDPRDRLITIRTADPHIGACATLIVGNSQTIA